MWSLPNRPALYAIRTQTTTGKSAGGGRRKRTDGHCVEFGRERSEPFRESLKTNPKTIPVSQEDILDTYRKYISHMKPELTQLFGLLPTPAAEYVPGTPDGSRPGKVYVNTGDYQHRSKNTIESTAYHEGIPGHHMQVSIAQELPTLPPFRQHGFFTARVEGWALYSERLGKELGFYQDPYSDFWPVGRLTIARVPGCWIPGCTQSIGRESRW